MSARASTSAASTPSKTWPTPRRCGLPRASNTASATARASRSSAASCATAFRPRAKPPPSTKGASMSEASVATTAGSIIKDARQAQGLHIAALAAAIKVPQKKLEALEADRFDELPDATFTRALAQTVCRSLKIDPAPVLALLPQLSGYRLEHVAEGINAPFRDRPGRREPKDWASLASPAVRGPLLLLLAATGGLVMPP